MFEISIIIPVYNAESYLESCLSSLFRQTIGFHNLEILIVDDCSTDNSPLIMQKYEHYENIKCIFLESNSRAAGKPRNEGMKNAHAEYFMFLDPDDEYYENACEILLNTIKETNSDIVSGYYSTFDDQNELLEENVLSAHNIINKMYYMPDDIKEISKFRYHFACKIYKSQIIKNNDILFPENIIGQDSVFMWNYLFNINNIFYISTPILKYRQRVKENQSVSYSLTKRHFLDIEKCMKLIYELFLAHDLKSELSCAFHDINSYYINQMIDSNLSSSVLADILHQWEWLITVAKNNDDKDIYTNIVISLMQSTDINHTAEITILLRELKKYYQNTAEGNSWLKQQIKNKDILIKELENHNNILEKQLKDHLKTISELRDWTDQLKEAKEYFLSELSKRDIEL